MIATFDEALLDSSRELAIAETPCGRICKFISLLACTLGATSRAPSRAGKGRCGLGAGQGPALGA